MRYVKSLGKSPLIAMGLALGVSQVAMASPLDMGSWNHIARIADDGGGMFDGNGELFSTYSYGTKTASSLTQGSDFQTTFDVYDGMQILFITGDDEVWGKTSYADLRAVIDARANDFNPNISFDARVNGVEQTVTGNVLSRTTQTEDPWIGLVGDHVSAVTNSLIVWGEDNWYSPSHNHTTLKNTRGGMNVFVSLEADNSVPVPAPVWLLGGLAGWLMNRRSVSWG